MSKTDILKKYELWNDNFLKTSLLLALDEYADLKFSEQSKLLTEQITEKDKLINELSIECGIDKSEKIGKSMQIQDMRFSITRLEEQLAEKDNELKIALGNVSKLESMIESSLNKTK